MHFITSKICSYREYKNRFGMYVGEGKNKLYFLEENKLAVKIRLRRMGKKKAPFYRVVVADSRFPRDGRFIEELGTYNPCVSPAEIKLDTDRAKAWIKSGAQPTDTVRILLKKTGAIEEK